MLLWTACDDVTGSSNNKESSEAEQISIEVETFDDLPNCTVNREGILAKTTDDGSIYKCSDKQWKTYKSGSSNGTASITCSIKEQEDSSGFLVICGEEVIGEIQNGQNGEQGIPGVDGLSAYEIAKAGGYTGTEAEWIASLKGAKGDKGEPGANGLSAYEIAKAGGYTGTEAEWIASLKGAKGDQGNPGQQGANGLSAYEIAVANGFTGTQAQWLATLQGIQGEQGANGLSAYEIAVANGFTGTQAQWLATLKGIQGEQGANGLSAYEIAVANGFTGTEAEWLASLKGENGNDGALVIQVVSTTAGLECNAQEIATGFKIVCNGDSIAFIPYSALTPSSSSSNTTASSSSNSSSSQSQGNDSSSSSENGSGGGDLFSSSSNNSSSSQGPISDYGTCAPSVTTTYYGDSVTWTFTRNSATFPLEQYANATFQWSFPGGYSLNTATKIAKSTYKEKGTYSATLVINGDTEHPIECAPSVNVTGAKIDCGCSYTGDMYLDVTDNPANVTWTAGCYSESTITGYNWDNTGISNSNTYTKTISASDISSQAEPSQTFSPTLKVTNADGAEASISCSSVAAFVTATSPVTITNGSMAILGPGKTYVVDITCPSWFDPRIQYSYENGNNYNYSGPPPVSGIIESDAGETREFSMYRGDRQYLPFTTSSTVDYTTYKNFTGLIYLSSGYVDLLCY